MKQPKCKICRRVGEKLFLKGERCSSSKCAMIKRPYPPGQRRQRRRRHPSGYAIELREKQKLRNWYNLKERKFADYVKQILSKRAKIKDASGALIKVLEYRFDNVIFRLGFSTSRPKARQLVSHGFFLVNNRATNIPSRQLKKGEVVSLKKIKVGKKVTQEIKDLLKKYKAPSWLELNPEKVEGKIIGVPTLKEVSPPVEIQSIFEFYSR